MSGVLLDAALNYAARGWPVLPCHPQTKQPLIKGGFKNASLDPQQIDGWLKRWPKALIAIATGPESRIFVVDFDAGEDKDTGEVFELPELIAAFEEHVGCKMPATCASNTPRGGRHLFFELPEGAHIPSRVGIVQRVDVRGAGGYVVVPPSVRADGVPYTWAAAPDVCPQAIPAMGLVSALEAKASASPARPAPGGGTYKRRYSAAYASLALTGEASAVATAQRGGRNSRLNQAAFRIGQIIEFCELTERQVTDTLEGAAAQCGLTADDGAASVRKTIASGLRAGRSNPKPPSGGSRERHPPFPPVGAARPASVLEQSGQPDKARRELMAEAAGKASEAAGRSYGLHLDERIQRELDAVLWQKELTDLGNAERFKERFADCLIWVTGRGWLHYDQGCWTEDGANALAMRAAQIVARSIQQEADHLRSSEDDEVVDVRARGTKHEKEVRRSDLVSAWGRQSEDSRRLLAMVKQAEPLCMVSPAQLDRDPYKINVRNGTLALSRSADAEQDPITFRPHDPKDYLTKVLATDYDPNAVCPTYDAFLASVQPSAAVRRHLHQWGGLSLTGDTSEQKFAIWLGKGRNGKSTTIEAWAALSGTYGRALPVESILDTGRPRVGGQASPDLAMLAGVRLAYTGEPPRNARLAEGQVKLMTGGDTMQVRGLHKDYFELKPVLKLTLCGNYRPKIDGGDAAQGIWRRTLLILWPVTIAKSDVDKKLPTKLLAELPGILNRLLDGLRDWAENGLLVPAEIEQATEDYRADSDPLGRFLAECTENDVSARTMNSELHRLFEAWALAAGETVWSKKGLTKALQDRGDYVQSRGADRFWKGLKLIKSVSDFNTSDQPPAAQEHQGDYGEDGTDTTF